MYMLHACTCTCTCRVYDARKHRNVLNGKWTEEKVYEEFLKSFDSPNDPDGKVGVSTIGPCTDGCDHIDH